MMKYLIVVLLIGGCFGPPPPCGEGGPDCGTIDLDPCAFTTPYGRYWDFTLTRIDGDCTEHGSLEDFYIGNALDDPCETVHEQSEDCSSFRFTTVCEDADGVSAVAGNLIRNEDRWIGTVEVLVQGSCASTYSAVLTRSE